MKKKLIKAYASAAAILLTATAGYAQGAYSNAVMNLNPVAYWPLQEAVQPPQADVETNLGSLGSIANAYYASTNALRSAPGAIVGDIDPAVTFQGNTGSFAIVPTTDHRVSLPPGQPFTVECWTRASTGQSFRGIITQTGPNNAGGPNGSTNSSGWSLNVGFGAYRGTGSQNGPLAWTFHVFNGNGFTGGAEAEAANNTGWLTGGTVDYTNSWVYLAGVFDGTNCWLYVYSTNLDNATWGGTNLMNVTGQTIPLTQLPITTGPNAPVGGPGTQIPAAMFSPDTWDPIMLGCTRGLGGNEFLGSLDEVAIYTNALTSDHIAGHFTAGTNGLGNYSAAVLADQPYMYWRMNAPSYTFPQASSFPTAGNYGSAAASMTNFNTLGTSAVYQPGTLPGMAGPPYAGFGTLTNACAFNGIHGAVDAGYNSAFDPTGTAANLSLVAWFKANPMDNNSRYNCMASHSDSSWKAQFRNGTTYAYKGAGAQPTIAPATFNVNDNQWHMYVLEATYTNGVSTNVTLSLDGGLASATLTNIAAIPGKPTMDAVIGGAPETAYTQPAPGQYATGQQYFAGRIAHVAYFNYALTTGQITNLFFTGKPGPTIFQQPVSATVDQGKAFTNTVTALAETYPLSYLWYKDGAPLTNQTSASLVLNPVLLSDQSSNYYVVVTNIYGAATSAVVSLSVRNVLTLLAQYPVSYTNPITLYGGASPATHGSSPTFSVSVTGATPSYQWRTNGAAMAGATNASLTFTNCQMASPTNFQCVVTNSFGALTSVWSVVYLPAPTAPFPQRVLADFPVCYWRLNEPDDQLGDGNTGAICNDYQSGNNGLYTNVYLGNIQGGTGYNPETDPTETSAQFGSPSPSIASGVWSNIDFSTPSGSNGEFSVAVWANGNAISQPGNAGLVSKGAWGAEQFTIDEGATASALRFTVRNAPGTSFYSANSSIKLGDDASWHYVVGVCDEANGNVLLYVDGQLAGTATIPSAGGILSSSEPLTIGARKGNAGAYNNQFRGFLNDVAIYNYVLSPGEILRQANAGGVGPAIAVQPPQYPNVNYGGSLVVSVAATGTPPLFYHWYDYNAGAFIDGQTNATLVLNGVTNNDSYDVTISNAYGSVTSIWVYDNVISGSPQVYTQVTNPFSAFIGQSAVNSVEAYGTAPLRYQWQFYNGTAWADLTDNGRINGSQSNTLTIASVSATDAGNYQVIVSNDYPPTASSSGTLTVLGLPLSFYGSGSSWIANGSARVGYNQVTLTDPGVAGQGSFFFQYPQYIGAFQASFTYQAGGNKAADGVTFCLQNAPLGAAALGGGGGQLGVGTGGSGIISPSAELEMNLFGTMGYAFQTNGLIGNYTPPGNVAFNSGNPINVTFTYAYGQAALSFVDATASHSYSTTLSVGDLTQVLGADTAYVGFTGAYGGSTSIQTITDFSFTSLAALMIQVRNETNVVVSWPGSVAGYGLQQNTDLTTTNWLNVTNADILTNSQHQIVLPASRSKMFYRLEVTE